MLLFLRLLCFFFFSLGPGSARISADGRQPSAHVPSRRRGESWASQKAAEASKGQSGYEELEDPTAVRAVFRVSGVGGG